MTKEQILSAEEDQLLDYLFGYAEKDAILSFASEDLAQELQSMSEDQIRDYLQENYTCSYFPSGPPTPFRGIYLPLGEIEIPVDAIEPYDRDEYTIHGDLAYLYVGYGLVVEIGEKEEK